MDATNGVTPETGITLGAADQAEILKANGVATVDISGATWAAVTGCDGWYDLTITTSYSDTLGHLTVVVQDESVSLPVFGEFEVVTANYWDSKYSTDVLQVDVTQWLGTAAATPTVAGVPEVDVTHWLGTAAESPNVAGCVAVDLVRIGGVTQSLIDLKDFVDSGYDPVTNKVQGVVLADTVTTLTGHTAQTGDSFARIGAAGVSLTDLGGMSTGMQTEVNNQVVDVIRTDTTSEMSQGAPPVDPTIEEMLAYIYFRLRNKRETTSAEDAIYDDAGTTKLFKAVIDDDGTTFTKDEYVSGA